MKNVPKTALAAAAVCAVLCAALLAFAGCSAGTGARSETPPEPAAGLDTKYNADGPLRVSSLVTEAPDTVCQKYTVWYPSELEDSSREYPLVIMANATGMRASLYGEIFRRLASWGFIAAGNEDENCRSGASSAATLDFVLSLNSDPDSPLYRKVDTEHIGIAGHSQGGVGAVNAVTRQENGSLYAALCLVSITSSYWSREDVFGPEWDYDISAVNIPCLMTAGTGETDAGTSEDASDPEGQGFCPLWSLRASFDAMPKGVPRVAARRTGADHVEMLRQSAGFMTAWFAFWLQGDEEAGHAFFGEDAEILTSPNWQDVQTIEP